MSPTTSNHVPDQLDSAWKCALEYLPVECLRLCFPAIAALLDLSRPFTILDSELHQPVDGIAPVANACHADRVLRCYTLDGQQVCVHIEVQCQHDVRFPERMTIYHLLLFAKYRLPVISLAILGDESRIWHPNEFGYRYGDSWLSMHFTSVKLIDLEPELPALLQAGNGFAFFVAAHLQTIRTKREPSVRLTAKCKLTEILQGPGWDDRRRGRMFELLDRIMQLPPAQESLYRQHFAKEYYMYVSLFDRFLEDTKQDWLRQEAERLAQERARALHEGREQGREQGKEEGRRMQLVDLAEQRFGPLPPHIGTRLRAADHEELQRLTKRICDAKTLDDLLD